MEFDAGELAFPGMFGPFLVVFLIATNVTPHVSRQRTNWSETWTGT